MSLKSWVYKPDIFLDLGAAGEHPVTFTSWIDVDVVDGREVRRVNITSVIVSVCYGDTIQDLNITPKILRSDYTREDWEDEIWKNYIEKQNKDFNEYVGA